ncbi:MAG: SPOR domain-containing protein [Pseudobdellovibrionaceae bacterium]
MSNNYDFDDPDGFFDRVLKSTSGQSQFWARRSFWGAVLMTVAVLALVTVIWLSYVNAPETPAEDGLPIIEANNKPMREAPENPGGLEIRNSDSEIYDAMRGSEAAKPKIENLLAEDTMPPREDVLKEAGIDESPSNEEEPNIEALADAEGEMGDGASETAAEEAPAEVTGAKGLSVEKIIKASEDEPKVLERPANVTTNTPEEVATSDADADLPPPGEFKAPLKEENPEETLAYVRQVLDKADGAAGTAAAEKPLPQPEPTKEDAAKQAPAIPTIGTGPDRFVQLGAFRDRASAASAWSTMQKKYPILLSGLTLRVQEADLGSKGMYYRVQGGPAKESRAKAICTAINADKSGSCLVAAP